MSNIEKVRKFVKELQQDFISIQPKDCSLDLIKSYAGYAYLDKVLSFLDTLESEKSMNQDGLEEEMDQFFETMPVLEHENIFEETFQNIARHFAEWGAEHLRDSTKMIGKSLTEAAEDAVCMVFGGDPAYYGNKAEFSVNECMRLFIAGAKWGTEHLRDTTKMIDKSLEEEANKFANQDCVTFISRKKGFIAGAEWQKEQDEAEKNLKYFYGLDEGAKIMKEQMLKDAIPFYEILKAVPSFERENTRIIIIKEEE